MTRLVAGAALAALLTLAPAARAALTPEQAMSGWPEAAKSAARITIAKYGAPVELGPDALVWRDNGPWKRTVVYRRAWPHYEDREDKDYLENTISYRVPEDKLAALARFDSKVDADPRYAELSARSESEAVNFLILNLADEIVAGKRNFNDARRFCARTARLAEAGKSSPYLERLLFAPLR